MNCPPPTSDDLPHSETSRKEWLRQRARELGLDALGITSTEPLPHEAYRKEWLDQGCAGEMHYLQRPDPVRPTSLLEGSRTLLVGAARYARPRDEGTPLAAYAQREDYHRVLRVPLEALAADLRALESGSRTRVLVDTAPLLEREAAARAGLGWIGKNTMLVHLQLGCFTLLGEILWTGRLEPDAPGVDHCLDCQRCLEACPTGALTAPYQMDARLCLSYLTIEQRGQVPDDLRTQTGTRAFGCDACLNACPFGGRNVFREGRLLPTEPELRDASLAELLDRASARFKKTFGWTPIERTRKRGLLRSLLIAAGNSGDPSLLSRVESFLGDEDPRIQEHAHWARTRLVLAE